MHVIAIVNGPGELSGWLLPVAARIMANSPDATVTAVMTPCQYASGRETEVAERSPGIARAVRFWPFARELWSNRAAGASGAPGTSELVVQFGGDPLYGRLAAWLLGAPLWRHGTSSTGAGRTERFLVPSDRIRQKMIRQGVPANRITPVGQLVVDSARVFRDAGPTADEAPGFERLLFLPGSRFFEIERMVPFFVSVADHVLAVRPATPVSISLSSFVDREVFVRLIESAGCTVESAASGITCRTPGGHAISILEDDWRRTIGPRDLAVLLPGTTTLQLAALGTPMVVVLPLNWGERVPFEGLLGLLLPIRMPFGLIKRYVTRLMNRFVGPIALPNIIAAERVVPELRGVLDPFGVATTLTTLLDDAPKRGRMSARLFEIAGPPGAADRMASEIIHRLAGAGGRS